MMLYSSLLMSTDYTKTTLRCVEIFQNFVGCNEKTVFFKEAFDTKPPM